MQSDSESIAVVLVHGLWMRGPDMYLLRRRLERCGFTVYQYSYQTTQTTLEQSAANLAQFIRREVQEYTVHLVGHSLGGLVIRRLLHDGYLQRPGRVVTLASPHRGSYVAQRIARVGVLRRMLGASLPALQGEVPAWRGEREIGSIAGRMPIGMGWIIRDLPKPNDGTVSVEETRIIVPDDHIVLPVTHMGMLVSKSVAHQVCFFLRHGLFDHSEKRK